MTTIVGLSSTYGDPGIVLASDCKLNRHGSFVVGGSLETNWKTDFRKVYSHKNFAFTLAGSVSLESMSCLWNRLQLDLRVEGGIDVQKRLTSGLFNEIRDMNLACQLANEENYFCEEKQAEFIFATNYGGVPNLYYVSPTGRVCHSEYSSAGNNDEIVGRNLRKAYESHDLDGAKLKLDEVFLLANGLVIESGEEDTHTECVTPDVVVVTKKSIKHFGKSTREKMFEIRAQDLKAISEGL